MKKLSLFCAVALLLSSVSIGCSSNGSGGGLSGFCRTGSIFPVARTREATQVVYQTAGVSSQHFSQCDPCEPAACNPCEPVACNPCEPIMCNPCEPVCDPCVRTGIITRGPIPGPF